MRKVDYVGRNTKRGSALDSVPSHLRPRGTPLGMTRSPALDAPAAQPFRWAALLPFRLLATLLATCLLPFLPVQAQAQTGPFDAAHRAYERGQFSEAKIGYEQLVEARAWSANLFYNLGNTDHRLGAPGRAILDYERALALDPAHPEARANLEVLRRQTGAKRRATVWQDRLLGWPAGLTAVAGAAASGWIALFGLALLGTTRRAEKTGLRLVTTAGLLTCAYLLAVLWWQHQESATAIVVAPSTEARLQPADSAGLAETLPAGSRVRVLRERGEWLYCLLPGQKPGWIPRPALERVRLGAS